MITAYPSASEKTATVTSFWVGIDRQPHTPVPYIKRPFANLLVKRRQLKSDSPPPPPPMFLLLLVLIWSLLLFFVLSFPPSPPGQMSTPCTTSTTHSQYEWMNPQFTYRFVALRRSFRTRRYALSPTTVSPKRLAIRFLASTYCGRISWPNWPVLFLFFCFPFQASTANANKNIRGKPLK